jgi:hypothetical protein
VAEEKHQGSKKYLKVVNVSAIVNYNPKSKTFQKREAILHQQAVDSMQLSVRLNESVTSARKL